MVGEVTDGEDRREDPRLEEHPSAILLIEDKGRDRRRIKRRAQEKKIEGRRSVTLLGPSTPLMQPFLLVSNEDSVCSLVGHFERLPTNQWAQEKPIR